MNHEPKNKIEELEAKVDLLRKELTMTIHEQKIVRNLKRALKCEMKSSLGKYHILIRLDLVMITTWRQQVQPKKRHNYK